MPRYVRDQISMLETAGKKYTKEEMDSALAYCHENNLPRAVYFEPILISLKEVTSAPAKVSNEVQSLQNSKYKIQPQTSNISDYKQILL